jgi:HNH endonuclease
MGQVIPLRVAERAATRYILDLATGCHISTYAATTRDGYARMTWREEGRQFGVLVHRASWVHFDGQIPDGLTVDHHVCNRHTCVKRSHLRLLTNFENARRTNGRDWPLGQCAHGHSNNELRLDPRGRRECAPCAIASERRYNATRRRVS